MRGGRFCSKNFSKGTSFLSERANAPIPHPKSKPSV